MTAGDEKYAPMTGCTLALNVSRSTALVVCLLLLAGGHVARAGINVWTTHGPAATAFTVAIDPLTSTTLYAATDSGVFKSTDAGSSWNTTELNTTVRVLAVDPLTPATLYASTGWPGASGLFKSTDAGGSWNVVSTLPNAAVLVIDPVTPSTLYAVTWGGAPFKSTDGGDSWNDIGPPRSAVLALTIDRSAPAVLYAGTMIHGVFKSTDAGNTWTQTGPENMNVATLEVDPTMPTRIFGGNGQRLFIRSTDGGASWDVRDFGIRLSALAVDPTTPGTLYAGTSVGVSKTTDAGDTWQALNTGLPADAVFSLAFDPSMSSTVYAATFTGVYSIEQVEVCTGDCNGDGQVSVDEVLTLVNVALGGAPAAACAHGLASGAATTDVNVALILQAIHNAFDGCG